jgi:hypothetical protein
MWLVQFNDDEADMTRLSQNSNNNNDISNNSTNNSIIDKCNNNSNASTNSSIVKTKSNNTLLTSLDIHQIILRNMFLGLIQRSQKSTLILRLELESVELGSISHMTEEDQWALLVVVVIRMLLMATLLMVNLSIRPVLQDDIRSICKSRVLRSDGTKGVPCHFSNRSARLDG